MSATKIPEVPLSSSAGRPSIPVLGMGTAAMPSGCDATKSAVIEAIRQGYRHFDTATVYMSEHAVGEAIAESLKLGLIASRDEIFITSKLWVTDNYPDLVLPALQKSLRSLQLQYVDLYLIHWPISVKPGTSRFPYEEEDVVPLDLKGVWKAMEECQKLGLTKSIGVSNFSAKKLGVLLSFATIPPSVNEVEMNPTWQQKRLREFCKEKGIVVLAYSPLGSKGTFWGTNAVMDNEILKKIAEARGKSVAQVSLRWLYEQGVAFVVKSYNKERMKQNLEIFDWSLTENDCSKINQIQQLRINNGPAPSVAEDLWDGET